MARVIDASTQEKKPQAGRRGSLMTRNLFGRRGSTEGGFTPQSANETAPKARRMTVYTKAQGTAQGTAQGRR